MKSDLEKTNLIMQLYSLLIYQMIQQIIVPLPKQWRNLRNSNLDF